MATAAETAPKAGGLTAFLQSQTGRYLALVEMKLALATLLGGFEIEWVGTAHGGPAAERLSFTMAPVGLAMRLRERP